MDAENSDQRHAFGDDYDAYNTAPGLRNII